MMHQTVPEPAANELIQQVRERVRKEHRKRGLRGNAFVTHRVTQLYPEGACVYFYLAIYAEVVCLRSFPLRQLFVRCC